MRELGRGPRDVSLYLHLPFCEALCTYCACNKTILRREVSDGRARVERYLAALATELEWRAIWSRSRYVGVPPPQCNCRTIRPAPTSRARHSSSVVNAAR